MNTATYQVPGAQMIAEDDATGYRQVQVPGGPFVNLQPPPQVNIELNPLIFAGAM